MEACQDDLTEHRYFTPIAKEHDGKIVVVTCGAAGEYLVTLLHEDVVDHLAHEVAAVCAGAGSQDLKKRSVHLPATPLAELRFRQTAMRGSNLMAGVVWPYHDRFVRACAFGMVLTTAVIAT